MRLRSLSLAMVAGCAVATPAWAHHSHGNYQMNEYTLLTGEVTEVHWINPHIWIYLEVADENGAEPTVWALESAGATGLARRGITKETVKAGDTVSVRCHQLRDGSNGCLLGFLTPPGGEEKEWD